jgi:hypothetical protein
MDERKFLTKKSMDTIFMNSEEIYKLSTQVSEPFLGFYIPHLWPFLSLVSQSFKVMEELETKVNTWSDKSTIGDVLLRLVLFNLLIISLPLCERLLIFCSVQVSNYTRSTAAAFTIPFPSWNVNATLTQSLLSFSM